MVQRRDVIFGISASTLIPFSSGCLESIGGDESDPVDDSSGSNTPNQSDSDTTDGGRSVNAGVTIEDDREGTISITFMSEGNADRILIRGDCDFETDTLDEVGETSSQLCTSGDTVKAVATNESGSETTVQTYTVS